MERVRELVGGFRTTNLGITVNLVPRDTSPGSEDLLLQPEAKFSLEYQITGDDPYSGTLRFQAPDPLEVKNRGRPDNMEWRSDIQEISANEVEGEDLVLMKVVLPSQYRGKVRGKIEVVECSGSKETKLCEHPIVSDPPLTHTSS